MISPCTLHTQRNKVNPFSCFTPIPNTESSSQSLAPLPEGCVEEFPFFYGKPQALKARVKSIFPFDVQLLTLLGKKPEKNYSFYNPSIIASEEENQYFMAFREADFNFCPNRGNLTPPYYSRIHFGISDNPRGPAKYCSTFTTKNSTNDLPNGPEDARFVYITPPGSKTPVLHMTFIHERNIHLAQVHYNITNQSCTAQVTNILDMWVNGTKKKSMQKNWMFIPYSTTPDGRPLFAYKVNPLKVLAVNMTSGEGTVVSSQPQLGCVPIIRGNTMFLQHPTKLNVFIGIVHEKESQRYNYYSRVITIEEFKPQQFQLIGVSDRFGFPEHNGDICMHNTHFTSSMMYADETKESVIIGMGYMDCTPHSVKVKTSDLLSSVKPPSC